MGSDRYLGGWDRPAGWDRSYYVDIKGPLLKHAVTPDAIMTDSTYPYHVQLGRLTQRQCKRIAFLLAQ